MKTTIYQKYVSRYSEVLTLVCVDYGDDELCEITPHALAKEILSRSVVEFSELMAELRFWQNEKASWEE